MRWPNGSQTQPRVSSAFGPRAGGGGASTNHLGTDFPEIWQVRAVASGRVAYVGTPAGWSNGGRQVWIQHNGFFSKSMHLASWNVAVGQQVDEGSFIGTQDTTGTATGSHLHLEITLGYVHMLNSGQIDPVPFIRSRISGNVAGSGGGNSETAQLQLDLNTIGYPLAVDGDYGPATTAAVTQFQTDFGLGIDGQAGPQTYGKLLELVKGLQTSLNALGYTLVVDGYSGPATVGAIKDFQGKNSLTVDGIAGPNTRNAISAKLALPNGYNAIPLVRSTADVQRLVGAEPIDNIWGPHTTEKVMAWQTARNLKADGIWGPESDAIGFPTAPAAYIPVTVDGKPGKETYTALQANLGLISFLPADQIGVLNVTTIKALQKAVGVPEADQDGIFGPQTVKYLQSSLGVSIDGQAGPMTWTALQTLLNRNGRLLPVPFNDDQVNTPVEHPRPAAPTYPDAADWAHSTNSSPRTGKVQLLILHHWGTNPIPTAASQWTRFNTALASNPVSPNWQVNSDGSCYEAVPPDSWRAWTTGQIDMQAVTIETQNESVGPQWGISQAAILRIAKILAFAAKRYNFPIQMGEVGPDNAVIKPGLIGHNMTPAGKSTGTVCPGPSMQAAYTQILNTARLINNPVEPPIDPPPPTDHNHAELELAWLNYKAALAAVDPSFQKLEAEIAKL